MIKAERSHMRSAPETGFVANRSEPEERSTSPCIVSIRYLHQILSWYVTGNGGAVIALIDMMLPMVHSVEGKVMGAYRRHAGAHSKWRVPTRPIPTCPLSGLCLRGPCRHGPLHPLPG